MTREQQILFQQELVYFVHDFADRNELSIAGVNIKIYASPQSFTVLVDSEPITDGLKAE